MYIKVGTWLTCGCCQLPFNTWVGYQDQDQDAEYGICQSCQGFKDEFEYDKIDNVVAQLDKKWHEGTDNHSIWSGYTEDERRNFVIHQIRRGSLTYDYEVK